MNKNFKWLIIILIIASFFRLFALESTPPGLYPDEAMNSNNALEAQASHEYKVFYPENNGREGLYANIQAVFFEVLPNEPWAARLPSALFGILSVLGLYLLTKELFRNHPHGEKIALLTAFLLSVSFWHINFSRIAFRAIMAPAFLSFSIYYFLISIRKNNYILAIIGGLLFGLGMHSYIAYRIVPLILIALTPFLWKTKNFWRNAIIFTVASLIAFAPLGLYYLNNPADFFGRTSQISIFSSDHPYKFLASNIIKTAGMFNFAGDTNFRHNYAEVKMNSDGMATLSGSPQLYWPVGIIFIIGLAASLLIFKKRKIDKDKLLIFMAIFSWLIIASLPVIISSEGMPHALRAILMIPPIFILAGYGGIITYQKLIDLYPKYKKIIVIFSFIFLFSVIGNTYDSYFIKWGQNPETQGAFNSSYIEIGKELNELPIETPKYVIVESSGVIVRKIPMPSQTVMFITNTFSPQNQIDKNIFYILPEDKDQIPENAFVISI